MITADGDLTMRHSLVQLDLKEVRLATALSKKLQCLLRAGGPIPTHFAGAQNSSCSPAELLTHTSIRLAAF
jgi:hypothetical protein